MAKRQLNRSFGKGMNSDIDDAGLGGTMARKLVNIDLVREGMYGAAVTPKGSILKQQLGALHQANILGMFAVQAQIDTDCIGFGDTDCGCDSEGNPVQSIPLQDALLVFLWDAEYGSRIFLYNTLSQTTYMLYGVATGLVVSPDGEGTDVADGQTATGLKFPSTGTIDGFYYPDNGIPYFYFIDNCNGLRKLALRWSCAEGFEQQSVSKLALRPLAAGYPPMPTGTIDGGNLAAGSYSFAWRPYNQATCRYGQWSVWSNPMPVVPISLADCADPSDTLIETNPDKVVGGKVGDGTAKAIQLSLDIPSYLIDCFDAVQIAVVKNTDGSTEQQLVAWISSPSADWWTNPTQIVYTGGEDQYSINVAEIVVEPAPLLTWKTMDVKDGRIFAANLHYQNFKFDNGDIAFDRACSITHTVEHAYKCEVESPKNRGYFRGEVERFGISYYDKYGNFSEVCPFDFSPFQRNTIDPTKPTWQITQIGAYNGSAGFTAIGVQGDASFLTGGDVLTLTFFTIPLYYQVVSASYNSVSNTTIIRIAGGLSAGVVVGSTLSCTYGQKGNQGNSTDWKFADRCDNQFTILNDQSQPQALGLRIEGIRNHPSWAVGFVIVRLDGERNIIGQTVHIPTIAARGVNTAGTQLALSDDLGLDYEPTLDDSNFVKEYDNSLDTYMPKKHISGTARNLGITNRKRFGEIGPANNESISIVFEGSVYRSQPAPTTTENDYDPANEDKYFELFETPPLILSIHPEYLYNNNGEPFESLQTDSSSRAKIVDALIFERKNLSETIDYVSFRSDLNIGAQPFPSPKFKNSADTFQALRAGQYFYNSLGLHVVELNDKWFGKLADIVTDFDAELTTLIERVQGLTLRQGVEILPYAPMVDNSMLGHIIRYGGASELSIQQGENSAIIPNTSVSTQGLDFGEEVHNQRATLITLAKPINDFSRLAATAFINDATNYFPLSALSWLDLAYNYQTSYNSIYLPNTYATTIADNNEQGRASCAAYILNIERGLTDKRYGAMDAGGQYIGTGVCVPLLPDDITNNTPITVDIFGGDCFITKQVTKVTDSNLLPLNYAADEADLILQAESHPLEMDDVFFNLRSEWKVGSHQDAVEILELWVESRVNTAYYAGKGQYPAITGEAITVYNQPYTYEYNPGYSALNNVKTWAGKVNDCFARCRYQKRVAYSDTKVPDSSIEGFDTFKAQNYTDQLGAEHGAANKVVTTDNGWLFVIQEQGIAPIPVGRERIELFDGTTLAVGTGSVIGKINYYLSTSFGTQHMRSIVNTGGKVYGIDVRRGHAWAFGNQERPVSLSEKGGLDSLLKELLGHQLPITIPEHLLWGAYDWNKKAYWIGLPNIQGSPLSNIRDRDLALVWNEKLQVWEKIVDACDQGILRAGYAGKSFFVIGGSAIDDQTIQGGLHQLYAANGKDGYLMDSYCDSSIETLFNGVGNGLSLVTKRFDVLSVYASERLDSVVATVIDELGLQPNQQATVSLQHGPRRTLYYNNLVRDDITTSRLHGNVLRVVYNIVNNGRTVAVKSVSCVVMVKGDGSGM